MNRPGAVLLLLLLPAGTAWCEQAQEAAPAGNPAALETLRAIAASAPRKVSPASGSGDAAAAVTAPGAEGADTVESVPTVKEPSDNAAPETVSGTVSLKVSPTAHGPNIYLGDLIAQKLPPDVAAMAVKTSGGPGSTVLVDPALVGLELRRTAKGPYVLKSGTRSISVAVPLQEVAGTLMAGFAEDYLNRQLSGTAGVTIEPQGAVLDLKLYDAPVRFRIHPPEDHSLRGYVVLRVEVMQAGPSGEETLVATVPASFLIHRHEARLVASQPIRSGEPFGAQNLQVQDLDATFSADGFSDLGMVEGKVARTFIPVGKALEIGMVDLPPAIRVGDMVKLVIRSGLIEVETTAKATRDARIGDSIPVQVVDTGRQVQARCVDVDVAVQNAW